MTNPQGRPLFQRLRRPVIVKMDGSRHIKRLEGQRAQ
jgi:hypothetical protein